MNKRQKRQIAKLAKQYGRKVFITAYRIVGDTHSAEDIVQDIYIKLFKKTPKAFDNVNNWAAYLTTMATSASLDLLRKRYRLSEQALSEAGNDVIEPIQRETPETMLSNQQSMEALRQALSGLSEQEAKVFTLRFIEEFSYQEIAEHLELTNSNVGIIISRTRQKLTDILKNRQDLGEKHEIFC